MSEKSLTELERRYFTKKNGGALPKEPLNNMKKRYWLGVFGGDRSTGFQNLEKQWLKKIIDDNGGTPSSNYLSTLYLEAVAALGGEVTKYFNSNKRQIYILDY